MAKTFFPKASTFIPFSKNEEYQYKISVGIEYWGGNEDEGYDVLKIQIAHQEAVQGRKSPSFPLDTDDFEIVMREAKALYDKYKVK